jgi:hypothetical protein
MPVQPGEDQSGGLGDHPARATSVDGEIPRIPRQELCQLVEGFEMFRRARAKDFRAAPRDSRNPR